MPLRLGAWPNMLIRWAWPNMQIAAVSAYYTYSRTSITSDVKPSTSLTTHLCKSAGAAAAILMTSRPPSYDTAMCTCVGHVTAVDTP